MAVWRRRSRMTQSRSTQRACGLPVLMAKTTGCRISSFWNQRHLFLVIARRLHLPAAVQGDADVRSWDKTRKHMLDLRFS
jgi:hypothetical protein